MDQFDSIVVGGGSGGLAFAQEAAALGARVMLIEHNHLGGTCVNRGCVPKKIMWTAGKLVRDAAAAQGVGILEAPLLHFTKLAERRDDHITGLREEFAENLDQAGVTLLRGTASIDGRSVTVDGETYQATNVIVATGARPTKLEIPGSEYLRDSQDVLSWTHLPKSMAITGGGYIGCEFAAIFAALGAEVTLIHDGETVLDMFPEDIARHVQTQLIDAGITLYLNAELTSVTADGQCLTFTTSHDETGTAEKIVSAVGRTPNTDTLGPLSDVLECADNGAVKVDDRLGTNVVGVYAIGDAANRMPLTPVATSDGTVLARMLHGEGGELISLNDVATTTFVYPPAAFVGSVDKANLQGTLRPLSENVLTAADGKEPAMYRIGFDSAQRLSGAQIVADHAEDLIALLASLKRAGATRSALERVIPIHPSTAEEFIGI